MLLQRFYSLIWPNPDVQIAYILITCICRYKRLTLQNNTLCSVHYGYTKSVASISNHVTMCSVTCSVLADPTWPLLENQGSQNSHSHVTVFCSMPLVFQKSGVLRTVNGAACKSHQLMAPKSNLHSNGPQVTPTNGPQVQLA
jgi:hypothetical protein